MHHSTLRSGFASTLVLASFTLLGQPIAAYTFSSSIEPYTAIAGGTVLGTSANTQVAFDNIPIGFDFNYGGVDYTTSSVSVNGFIKLGGAANPDQLSPISGFDAQDTVICVFGGYLRSNPDGELTYLTSGTAPDRVFTVQWTNYAAGSNFGEGTDHSFDFQLRLHETTGVIEFHYGIFDINANGADVYASVGLRGNAMQAPIDLQTRLVDGIGSTWETSVASDLYGYVLVAIGPPPFGPPAGLLYTLTPSSPCTGAPTGGLTTASVAVACPGAEVALALDGATPYTTGITYTWQTSPDGNVWTDLGVALAPSWILEFQAAAYLRCIVGCGGSSDTSTVVFVDAVPPNTYATVPFTENFNDPWEDRCDVANVPTAENWSSNPTSGPLAWRGVEPASVFLPVFDGSVALFNNINGAGSSTPDGFTGDLDLYVDLSSGLSYTATFQFISSFGSDSLEVLLSTDGGQLFTRKGLYKGPDQEPMNAQWNLKSIVLGNVGSATSVIRFRGWSDGFGGVKAIDDLSITGCVPPSLNAIASADTICAGNSATLTASGADQFLWNTGATAPSITVSPAASTTYTVIGTSNGCSTVSQVSVVVDPCLGLDENSSSLITIGPVPTMDLCFVEFNTDATRVLRLFDLTGREVQQVQSAVRRVILDLSDLPQGMYIMNAQTLGEGVLSRRIFKN